MFLFTNSTESRRKAIRRCIWICAIVITFVTALMFEWRTVFVQSVSGLPGLNEAGVKDKVERAAKTPMPWLLNYM
jgi:hypothetical protein